MDPYTRETVVVERRALAVHWSAVFAGALVAAGLWLLLQMLGTGIGLASIDTDDLGALRRAGIGTNAWSIIACIASLFAGGYVAARLSATRDRISGGAHGLLTWALTAVFGMAVTVVGMSFLATGVHHKEYAREPALDRDPVALAADLDVALMPANAHQRELKRPTVTVPQIVEAARGENPDALDNGRLADKLATASSLTRAEAMDVWSRIGGSTADIVDRSNRLAAEETRANRNAAMTGHAILAAGLALLLGLGGALLGAMAALKYTRPRVIDHTAPYPVVRD